MGDVLIVVVSFGSMSFASFVVIGNKSCTDKNIGLTLVLIVIYTILKS
jgi:hypothetical protein